MQNHTYCITRSPSVPVSRFPQTSSQTRPNPPGDAQTNHLTQPSCCRFRGLQPQSRPGSSRVSRVPFGAEARSGSMSLLGWERPHHKTPVFLRSPTISCYPPQPRSTTTLLTQLPDWQSRPLWGVGGSDVTSQECLRSGNNHFMPLFPMFLHFSHLHFGSGESSPHQQIDHFSRVYRCCYKLSVFPIPLAFLPRVRFPGASRPCSGPPFLRWPFRTPACPFRPCKYCLSTKSSFTLCPSHPHWKCPLPSWQIRRPFTLFGLLPSI